ncbi:hypothetical protein GCM10009595_10400 [Falsarthrobacter nasiphocae]
MLFKYPALTCLVMMVFAICAVWGFIDITERLVTAVMAWTAEDWRDVLKGLVITSPLVAMCVFLLLYEQIENRHNQK